MWIMHHKISNDLLQQYLLGEVSARDICLVLEGVGLSDVYHAASRAKKAGASAAPREPVWSRRQTTRVDKELVRELFDNGASEAEMATYFTTTKDVISKALRASREAN